MTQTIVPMGLWLSLMKFKKKKLSELKEFAPVIQMKNGELKITNNIKIVKIMEQYKYLLNFICIGSIHLFIWLLHASLNSFYW